MSVKGDDYANQNRLSNFKLAGDWDELGKLK